MRILLVLIILFVTAACDNKKTDDLIVTTDSSKKHKEADLVPESKLVSHNDTVILKLEDYYVENGDTGTVGTDVVTYEFTHSVNQKVCLEKHEGISYQLVIKDEDQNETLKVEDGECKTFKASASIYHFHISYSSFVRLPGSSSAVFIRPLAETTHCEDYESSATQSVPEETVEMKTVNHCTEDPNLICTIPETYQDIPYECRLEGPWYYSDNYECIGMLAEENANCRDYLYNKCDMIEKKCLDFWTDYSDSFDYWGNSGYDIWRKCFGGNKDQYLYPKYSKIADPVIKSNFKKYTKQFCKDVENDCLTGWKIVSSAPENCDGFVKHSKYSDLNLKSGEVAIYQRTYLHLGRNSFRPQDDDIVMVLNGKCANIPHRVGGFLLGPKTQVVAYAFNDLEGMPAIIDNDSDTSLFFKTPTVYGRLKTSDFDPYSQSLLYSTASSVTVTAKSGTEEDLCRIKDAGIICDSATKWDVLPKLTGDVVIVKKVDEKINAGTNCAAAYLFDYRCDDLNKLGLKNYGPDMDVPQIVSKAIMHDSNTVLRTFQNTNFTGSVKVSQGNTSVPSTVYLDAETISSIHAYKLPDYNHAILISLRKCCGCDLENVSFAGEDLSNTVLVGSNMKNTSFSGVDLTGSDLRETLLTNARFSSVKLGDNYFGCTDMNRVDMSDPSDSSKSTVSVSNSSTWNILSTYNGITVSCDENTTNLTSAKIPVQILSKKSWRTINLQKATLLDKVDGYDLSGIDLSDSDFTDLKVGGKVMKMHGANLSGSNLTNADFSSIDFSPLINDKNAQYSNFSNTKIGGTSFANANLEGADFKNVSVDGMVGSVNFSYALMINTVIADADIGRADFSYAYFFSKFRENVETQKKAKAENIVAQDGVFTGSFMSNMIFTNATFKNCNFNGAQLVGTTFSSGDLSNSKFSDTYLQGADLTGPSLTDASFSGAYFSLEDGYWHYTSEDPECSEIRINYNKTKLGDTSTAICPSGEKGPCDTEEKLSRKDKKTMEPPCVDGDEDIFGDTDCITHEYLEKNTIPKCDESNEDVMQCGCLIEGE